MRRKKIFKRNEITELPASGLVIVNDGTEELKGITPENANFGGGGLIAGTYSELENLYLNDGLTPGRKYKLTDFSTKYQQHETGDILTGTQETLILTAIDVNVFDVYVQSPNYPNDTIKYDFSNNICEDGATPRPGKIIERIDDKGNKAPYDCRNVLFPRWETSPGSGVFIILTDNGNTKQDFLTFGNNCQENILGRDSMNVVLNDSCRYNVFGINCEDITLANDCKSNVFGDECRLITFDYDCENNILGNECRLITFDHGCENNILGNSCNNLTTGKLFVHNEISPDISFGGFDMINANHVYQNYDCKIFTSTGLVRLKYFAGDVLTIVSPDA